MRAVVLNITIDEFYEKYCYLAKSAFKVVRKKIPRRLYTSDDMYQDALYGLVEAYYKIDDSKKEEQISRYVYMKCRGAMLDAWEKELGKYLNTVNRMKIEMHEQYYFNPVSLFFRPLEWFFKQLSNKQGTIAKKSMLEFKKTEEIAKEENTTKNNVLTHISHAKRELRKIFGNY